MQCMGGLYSGTNFATNDRFGLIYLFTVKSDKIQLLKGIIVTNYFEITRKLK